MNYFYFSKTYRLASFIILLLSNQIFCMDNQESKVTLELSDELLLHIAWLGATDAACSSTQQIKNLVALGGTNKQCNDISHTPELWRAIFSQSNNNNDEQSYTPARKTPKYLSYFSSPQEKFLYKVSLTSLALESRVGKEFYSIFVKLSFMQYIMTNPTLQNAIRLANNHNNNEQPLWPENFSEDHIKLASTGLTADAISHLSLFFKICCNAKMNFSDLEKLYDKSSKDDDTYKSHEKALRQWATYTINNIIGLYFVVKGYAFNAQAENSITKNTAVGWGIENQEILSLCHSLILYLTRDKFLEDSDQFKQNPLIKACRLKDKQQVELLLETDPRYKDTLICQEDVLGLNVVRIAIMNHSNDILDILLDAAKESSHDNSESIKDLLCFPIKLSNVHALKKILTFYKDLSYFESYLPWGFSNNKDTIKYALDLALSLDNNKCEMIKLFFDKGFILSHFTVPSLPEVLQRYQHYDRNDPKAEFIRNHFKTKSWF